MDEQAWRIRDLVVDACWLLEIVASHGADPALLAELAKVRDALLDACACTCDDETYDDACAVVGEVDLALAAGPDRQRGAA